MVLTPSAPHQSAVLTLPFQIRSDSFHPIQRWKSLTFSDLNCVFDLMTGGTYRNSINAPLVTFCFRVIAPLNLSE